MYSLTYHHHCLVKSFRVILPVKKSGKILLPSPKRKFFSSSIEFNAIPDKESFTLQEVVLILDLYCTYVFVLVLEYFLGVLRKIKAFLSEN